jgi:hypothetical protein
MVQDGHGPGVTHQNQYITFIHSFDRRRFIAQSSTAWLERACPSEGHSHPTAGCRRTWAEPRPAASSRPRRRHGRRSCGAPASHAAGVVLERDLAEQNYRTDLEAEITVCGTAGARCTAVGVASPRAARVATRAQGGSKRPSYKKYRRLSAPEPPADRNR